MFISRMIVRKMLMIRKENIVVSVFSVKIIGVVILVVML